MARPFQIEGKSGWWIRYTDEFGKRRKKSFGKYADALDRLLAEQVRVRDIKVGLRSPTPPAKTYDELADYWVAYRVPQKRSGYHDESIIRAHLRPFYGSMLVRDIGVADGDRYQLEKSNGTAEKKPLDKKTINNHLTLLIAQLNLAHELGWIAKVPKIRKPRIRLFEADYSYLRTKEEIRRLLAAAEAEGELVCALYATAIFTGMRAGELAALTWDDVDFEKRLITVQRSFDGPTKAGDVRHVPILDVLFPVLRRWRLQCPGKLLFPNQNGEMQGESARVFQEILHRMLDAAAFPSAPRRGKVRRYIVFHDLRHTFASHWIMDGGDIFKLQKILGHKDIKMTMRYAHLAPAAFAGDLARLGETSPRVGAVLELPNAPGRELQGNPT